MPFPANYGGAIDEFYKIKALHQIGVKIILHCFVYADFKPQSELEKYCDKVLYYKRNDSIFSFFSFLPFIVKSRANKNLLNNLLLDEFPILFEGLHTTAFLSHYSLTNRIKIIRIHNIEHLYYKQLFTTTKNIIKKIYYYFEYKKLFFYEKTFSNASSLLTIAQKDDEYYRNTFSKTKLIYPFHANTEIKSLLGKGKYVLLHGNLSIADNYLFLIKNYTTIKNFEIIIAGKNPTRKLIEFCNDNQIKLIQNPTDAELFLLIQQAHINLIFSEIETGIKLKLINALFHGRFVFVNEKIDNEYMFIDNLISVNENNLNDKIAQYMKMEFEQSHADQRKIILQHLDTTINAHKIVDLI